jgi:hypothetical protein
VALNFRKGKKVFGKNKLSDSLFHAKRPEKFGNMEVRRGRANGEQGEEVGLRQFVAAFVGVAEQGLPPQIAYLMGEEACVRYGDAQLPGEVALL